MRFFWLITLSTCGFLSGGVTQAQQASSRDDLQEAVIVDKSTNLMWSLCPLGSALYTYKEGPYAGRQECKSTQGADSAAIFRWFDAIEKVTQISYAGYNDWRIPTRKEIESILRCEDYASDTLNPFVGQTERDNVIRCQSGSFKFASPLKNFDKSWIAATDAKQVTNPLERRHLRLNTYVRGIDIPDTRTLEPTMMVRGGNTVDPDWKQAITDASELKNRFINKEAEDLKLQQKNQQEQQKSALAAAQKYKQDTENLRRNVKPGDKIQQGLVIEVKGALVLVQKPAEWVCTMYEAGGRCNSLSYKSVPGKTTWLSKEDITPVPSKY